MRIRPCRPRIAGGCGATWSKAAPRTAGARSPGATIGWGAGRRRLHLSSCRVPAATGRGRARSISMTQLPVSIRPVRPRRSFFTALSCTAIPPRPSTRSSPRWRRKASARCRCSWPASRTGRRKRFSIGPLRGCRRQSSSTRPPSRCRGSVRRTVAPRSTVPAGRCCRWCSPARPRTRGGKARAASDHATSP